VIVKPQVRHRFLKSPDPAFHSALIYGPDGSHVRDVANALQSSWLKHPEDPFALVVMCDDDLRSDPARLEDEWRSLTLTGTGRLIRLRLSGGEARIVVDALRSIQSGEWLPAGHLIIEASELRKGAALRTAFEKDEHAAAIALYEETSQDLLAVVRETAGGLDGNLADDAAQNLIERFGADRALLRSEVEKLVLYVGDRPGPITAEDVDAIASLSGENEPFAIVDACLEGLAASMDSALLRFQQSGKSGIAILRILQLKAAQLLRLREDMDKGQSLEQALGGLRPPVFGARRDEMKRLCQRWSTSRLCHAMSLALESEALMKQTGGNDEALLGLLLHRICKAAQRA
jgi:DNA polymerase III subunit delta